MDNGICPSCGMYWDKCHCGDCGTCFQCGLILSLCECEAPAEVKPTLIALYYTESHPDRYRTFLGIFSSQELAEKKMAEHMRLEKRMYPQAYIDKYNYSFNKAELDNENIWD
jgi:hypothetical protein